MDEGMRIWREAHTRFNFTEALTRGDPNEAAAQVITDAMAADKAEIARLREALGNINRKASPDPERTMSEASNDLYWCACEARAALEKTDV